MIYEPVLSAGHTSITRTSKDLHKDTKVALQQYGIFRGRLAHHFGNIIPSFALYPQIEVARVSDIRNVNLRFEVLNMHERPLSHTDCSMGTLAELLQGLIDAIGSPRRCNFKLDMGGYDFIEKEGTDAFSLLRDFEHVSLQVCVLRFSIAVYHFNMLIMS